MPIKGALVIWMSNRWSLSSNTVKIQLSTAILTCCAAGGVVRFVHAMCDYPPISVFITHITIHRGTCQEESAEPHQDRAIGLADGEHSWYAYSQLMRALTLSGEATMGEATDGSQVMHTLQQGIETPEHAAFVRQLQEQRRASSCKEPRYGSKKFTHKGREDMAAPTMDFDWLLD